MPGRDCKGPVCFGEVKGKSETLRTLMLRGKFSEETQEQAISKGEQASALLSEATDILQSDSDD